MQWRSSSKIVPFSASHLPILFYFKLKKLLFITKNRFREGSAEWRRTVRQMGIKSSLADKFKTRIDLSQKIVFEIEISLNSSLTNWISELQSLKNRGKTNYTCFFTEYHKIIIDSVFIPCMDHITWPIFYGPYNMVLVPPRKPGDASWRWTTWFLCFDG